MSGPCGAFGVSDYARSSHSATGSEAGCAGVVDDRVHFHGESAGVGG